MTKKEVSELADTKQELISIFAVSLAFLIFLAYELAVWYLENIN